MKNIFRTIQIAALTIPLACLLNWSCTEAKYDDDFVEGDPPPVPGGFVNSSEVAASNLLAYWNFNGDKKESISGVVPSSERNASFVSGIKGQALRLDSGWVLYPTISALSTANAVSSVTVAVWVRFRNNGAQASEFFALTQDPTVQSDWLTILNVAAETGRSATSNNLVFHSWIGSYSTGSRRGGDNINDFGVSGVDFQTVPRAGEWVHYIMRYDGATSTIDLFANSIRVSNNNFRVRTGLGPLVATVPTRVLLGAFPTLAVGYPNSGNQSWQDWLTGSMDELRVYNKALTDVEISALYKLERQGR
ncbi:MAG TPA: LamG-like jellyroll fold domain-containing protein [Chitinophagaceae bacterium]